MCRNLHSNIKVTDEAEEVKMKASRIRGIMRLLRISTAALLLPAVLTMCLPRQALANGNIHRVKHVIIVMQENHSFDNYFGALAYADRLSTPSHFPRHSPRDRRKQEKDGVHPRMAKSVSPSAAARERFMLESQERGESVGHEQN